MKRQFFPGARMMQQIAHTASLSLTVFTVIVAGAMVLLGGCAQKARTPIEGERVLRHVIADGETIEDIAYDYYGDAGRAGEILEFNLHESDEFETGEVVRVYMSPEDLEALGRRRNARIPYNRALEKVARGSYLDAITAFKDAIDLDPDFDEAVYNLGVTLQKMNAHEKAIEQFERAIDIRGTVVDYHFAAGNSYFYLKIFDRAVRAFENALALNSLHLKSQFSLAVSLENCGETDRARNAWLRYLELDGDSEWAQRARARLARLKP